MKRIIVAALAAALLLGALAGALAEGAQVQVYVSKGALDRATARHLVALARAAYPQAEWSVSFEEDTGVSLRERVLSDSAPQIAICAPQQARTWAREGLLVPLEGSVGGLERMQEEVVEACVLDESLFMAPLAARQRRMAVNGELLERLQLGYLLDERAHPVWTPSELYQAVEEAALSGVCAMEIWTPREDSSGGIEALLQCLYGGRILAPDGSVTADGPQMTSALLWLRDMARDGAAGRVQERETALEHFLDGQTLLFFDWTDEEAARAAGREGGGFTPVELPYPASSGVVTRAFEPVGAAVFAGRDAQATGLALRAVALFTRDARAQSALGERPLWEDGAQWLTDLAAREGGATLRQLFAEAVKGALDGSVSPREALKRMADVAKTLPGE